MVGTAPRLIASCESRFKKDSKTMLARCPYALGWLDGFNIATEGRMVGFRFVEIYPPADKRSRIRFANRPATRAVSIALNARQTFSTGTLSLVNEMRR